MSQRKTYDTSKFCIIVPFYNEQSYIYPICAKLLATGYNILFVDDGSTDYSLPILKDLQVKLGGFSIISYSPNRGKGYAIKKGALEAIKKDYDWFLFFDSDGQNAIEDIEKFLATKRWYEFSLKEEPKIYIGNRLDNPKGMPKIRWLTNKIMSWIISKLSKQYIADSQCGMRLIHKDVFAHKLESDRFELESEMLIKTGRNSQTIVNIPISCIYKKGRESKINPLPDFIRFFKMLFKIMAFHQNYK